MDFSEELSQFEEGSQEHEFISKVIKKLGTNLIRESVEDKKREVRNQLDSAVQGYFQSYIFTDALIKSAEQLEASKRADPSSSNVHSIYLNSVEKYLLPESAETLKLFGLNKENTSKTLESKKSKSETIALKKLTEDNINEFCIKLIQCTGGIVLPGEDWKSAFDRTIKDLEDKATLLNSEETKQRSKKQLKEVMKTYNEELAKNVMLLRKLLSLYEKKLDIESNLAKFYLHRCHTIFLKIRVLEMKVLSMTYNEETVPALQKISNQLDQKEQRLLQEQNEKTVALDQYLKLGKEYEQYVEEFSRLTKDIQKEQWAIDELKSKKIRM